MSSTNGSTTPAQSSNPACDAGEHSAINGCASASAAKKPATEFDGTSKPTEPPKILDEKLEENDIRIVISFDLHNRTTQVANLKMDRIVFEGAVVARWVLLQALENVLAETRRVAADKLSSKLPVPKRDETASQADEAVTGTGVVDLPEDLVIHHPPSLGSNW
jgi:hypothetical protein